MRGALTFRVRGRVPPTESGVRQRVAARVMSAAIAMLSRGAAAPVVWFDVRCLRSLQPASSALLSRALPCMHTVSSHPASPTPRAACPHISLRSAGARQRPARLLHTAGMQAVRMQRPRARALRCRRSDSAVPAGGPPEPALCRICWEGEEPGDEGRLVAPCACSGSMRHVHVRCLRYWQAQLRAQKGIKASRRCDVCKAAWAKPFLPPACAKDWKEVLVGVLRSVPWSAVLECWKFGVFLAGTVHGVQAGVSGFRCGMRWAAAHSRANMQLARSGVRWAPEVALAAGTVPPLKVPLAVCVGAFVAGLAAQAALMSMVCAYAGTVAGFAAGVTQSLQATVHLGGCLLHKGTVLARAAGGSAVRGVAAAGQLAGPLLLGLLRTLALSRMFA